MRLLPWKARLAETAAVIAARAALAAGMGLLALLAAYLVVQALPALNASLLGDRWSPLADPPALGTSHALLSSLMVAGIALALALPFGIGAGLFLSEVAPPGVRALVSPALDLLAGIPSVVYGFFGAVTIVRWSEAWGRPTGESLLAAGVVLAVMALPFVASTSAEAFRAVPGELREAARSLGATRAHAVRRVVLRAAAPGVFAAGALGFARAAGETLAVLLLSGNTSAFPRSPLDRGQPVTALLATELGETAAGSAKYHALFAAGLLLALAVAAVDVAAWTARGRMARHAA